MVDMRNVFNYVCGLIIFMLVWAALSFAPAARAEGTISNVGATVGSDAGSDAISWSNAMPIMVDSYGHYIVPTENNNGNYYFSYSNDKGATWSSSAQTTLQFRPSAVYDSRNDKIHVLIEETSSVRYRRYTVLRNSSYQITGFAVDPDVNMEMEQLGTCSASEGGTYPILLWKDNGSNGILVAFWEVKKTCSSTTYFQTRTSMRTLSNTSADATASNWAAPNGTNDNGTGSAIVPYNTLYTYTGTPASGHKFTHSAFIRGGSGSKSEDIYYFNIDENETFGFRRLGWNGIAGDWSNAWTSRATFGGDVIGIGYSGNDELVTKPVYDSNLNRVYIGIARYLSGGEGDTQSLFYVDSSDSVSAGVNIYSAGGAAWFAPTLDIMFNSVDNKVYLFYQTSDRDPTNALNTNTSFEGNAWYRTYDGTTLGTPQPFLTQQIGGVTYTVDIPIVYQVPDNDRIILFFRGDGPETPFTPPHYIFFGYIPSGGATAASPVSAGSSPYSLNTFNDFVRLCATKTNTQAINAAGGEVSLMPLLRDDFETPIAPYNSLFGTWISGDWDSNSATTYAPPAPSGTELIYGAHGAYIYDSTTYSKKTLEFRAKFTAHSFQHIGWSDNTNFGTFIIFSTSSQPTPGNLYARTSNGTTTDLGGGYTGAFHTYKIEWGSDIKFYIDGALVATINENISSSLNVIASNNTTTSGSDLTLDWAQVTNYSSTTGSYQTCVIDSGGSDTTWGTVTYTGSTPGSTSYTVKSRTSNDNASWSSWSSSVASGGSVSSPVGKFIQFLFDLTGSSVETPTVNSLSVTFASPTPTPTSTTTPTPTRTPTPTSTPAQSSGSGQSAVSSVSSQGPSSVPVAGTSHIFITDVGNLHTLFLSSEDGSTIPKEPLTVDTRTPRIEGIADAGTYVVIKIEPGGREWRMQVPDSSHFIWNPPVLEYGTYTIAARVEEDGKIRRLPDFKILIKAPLTLSNVEITNVTESPAPTKQRDQDATQESGTPTPTTASAQTGKDVNIEVKDKGGRPLRNTEVILYSDPKKSVTNDRGIAEFHNIEPGVHTLVVNTADSTGSQRIQVDDDPTVKQVHVSVVIEPRKSVPAVWFWSVVIAGGIVILYLLRKLKNNK